MKTKRAFRDLKKRLARANHELRDPQLMHPAREWSIGLLISLIIFLLCAAWSAQMYVQYRTASVIETESAAEEVIVYRESLVEAALQRFAEREATQATLIETAEPVTFEAGRTNRAEVSSETDPEENVGLDSEAVLQAADGGEVATSSEPVLEALE